MLFQTKPHMSDRALQDVRYTIVRDRYAFHGDYREKVPGLHAQFRLGLFDSEAAARTEGWTDEERIQVEDGLKRHADFGGAFITVDDEELARAAAAAAAGVRTTCVLAIPDPDGSVTVCGAEVAPGSDFCAPHDALINGEPATT